MILNRCERKDVIVLFPEKPHAHIRAEQVRLLYQQGSVIQMLGVLIAVATAVLLREVADDAALLVWVTAVVAVLLIRLLITKRFLRISGEAFDVRKWEYIYVAGAFASGVTWGLLTLFYTPDWPIFYQAMLFIVITGVIGAAFNTNGSVFIAFPAFYVPLILFLTYAMLRQNEEGHTGLAILFLIYAASMHASSVRFYNRLTHTLRLQHENEKLNEQLAKSNERLIHLAEIDPLTQVFNRRFMDRFLSTEWKRHLEERRAISMLFIDIDFFKQYNDTYGHSAGDDCLSTVARALKGNIRIERDIVARYGGEEFAVILPHTECAEAQHIADRIMTDIWALDIEHAASEAGSSLTVSIGIASMIPDKTHDETTLVKIADDALYNAKRTGRNRITCAD